LTWKWDGRVALERVDLGPAELTLGPVREVTFGARPTRVVTVEERHPRSGTCIRWWLAAGIGLVRVDVDQAGRTTRGLSWPAFPFQEAPGS